MSEIKLAPRATKSCNAEFMLPTPVDVESYDALAGKTGQCLEDAVDKAVYHSWNSKFRSPLVKRLVEETGVAVPGSGKFKTTKNEDGTETKEEVPISEALYTKQLLASGAITQGQLNAIAQEVADTIPFAKAFEGGRQKTPSKTALAKAQGVFAAVAAGQATLDTVLDRLRSQNPTLVFSDDVSEEELAFAIMADDERRSREALNELLA